ncbi:IPT/TIG domain-containing protein [Candidatus Poribacteria bacterium]|nr:IPT/TIG domain-containing protein [Candidatus Poribacteria bacterium]
MSAGAVGTVDVGVENLDGQSATLADGFTYVVVPPKIASIEPQNASTQGETAVTIQTGGTDIQISGANFVEGIVVTIGGAQVSEVVVISDTLLAVKTPIGETGARDVAVANPDGQSTQLTGGFSYIALTGDINEDNVVDIFNLVLVSAEFGKPDPDPKADLNDDGKVDVFDLVIIGSQFSQSIAAAPAVFGARQAIRKRGCPMN